MNATITEASSSVLADLVTSAGALFSEDGGRCDPMIDTKWPAKHGNDYYRDLIADEHALCLLVWNTEGGGNAVGHLVGRIFGSNPLRPAARVGVLESMRVGAEQRRTGIGSALIARFTEWATRRRATELSVTAYAGNSAAIALYREHGFEPFELALHRQLRHGVASVHG